MSKKMTPCEKLGYKVGDEFTMKVDDYHEKGRTVFLGHDDGTDRPIFSGAFVYLSSVKKVAKLKPAKQALADAIHQNGGWLIAGDYSFVTSNHRGVVKFFHQKPRRDGVNWVGGSCSLSWVDLHQQLPNWHQCILSSDEYFSAYPEQKVEVEMKSESEIKIKVGDWHKNGELPPVGEVCEFVRTGDVDWHKQLNTGTEVTILAHYSPCNDGEMVAVFCHKVCDNTEDGRLVDQGIRVCFRPLRTERDRAIDEMMSVAAENWGNLQDCCERLYEYGYRKEVK